MTRRLLATVFVALFLLAACGGDDDSPAVATDKTTTTTNASGGDGGECDEPEPGCPGNLDDAVVAFRATPDACASAGGAAELPEGIEPFDTLTDTGDGQLIAIVCDTFAYQATYDLRFWDGTEVRAVQVQQWRDGAVTDDSVVLGSPFMDGDHLVNLEKARGPGDCGIYSVWTVSSTELALLEVHSQECNDNTMDDVDPAAWPTVYTAD